MPVENIFIADKNTTGCVTCPREEDGDGCEAPLGVAGVLQSLVRSVDDDEDDDQQPDLDPVLDAHEVSPERRKLGSQCSRKLRQI